MKPSSTPFCRLLFCLSLCLGLAGRLPAEPSRFGADRDDGGALIGILYDLKQTQQGERSEVTVRTYADVIAEFLARGWDEAVLNRYFRVSRPVYATRIHIPMISAEQAPEAFGVAGIVEPRTWVVHYKGQAEVPMDGLYRLAGFADDIIVAGINGETVLLAPLPSCDPKNFDWQPSEPGGIDMGRTGLRYGDWISLKKGEVVDLDVLVGERPGGAFGARLYVQRKGESYPTRDAKPVLPALQLGPPGEGMNVDNKTSAPRESSVWKALR